MEGKEGRTPSPNGRRNSNENGFYLAVRNLTRNVNEGHLKEIFGFYGAILKVSYPMHPNTGYPTGGAVIEYVEDGGLEEALKGMNGGQIDGNVIECYKSKYSTPPPPQLKHREPQRRNVVRPGRGFNRVRRSDDHYRPSGRRYDRSKSPVRRRSFSRSRSPLRRPISPPVRPARGRKSNSRSPPERRISRSQERRFSRSQERRFSRSQERRFSRSPAVRRFSRSPPRRFSRSRSPARRSPTRRSPSRQFSRSPVRRFSRSPARRFSRSPPRRFSRSPARRFSRSPPRRFSRSPPLRRFSRSRSPPHDRSPRYRNARRSPSRSPIPVSRMNY